MTRITGRLTNYEVTELYLVLQVGDVAGRVWARIRRRVER